MFSVLQEKVQTERVTKLDFLAGKPGVMPYCCHLFMRTIFQV